MPKRATAPNLPGNDGRWFLELVGVAEPAPESTDAYATLESLVPPPTADDTATLSTAAVAAAVNGALSAGGAENGEFVPLTTGAARAIRDVSHRRWRWWALATVAALLIVAVGAGVSLLPRSTAANATMLAASYRAALVEVRSELPATQQALASLTDLKSSDDAVSTVPTAMADLNAKSARAAALGTQPLPGTPPLVSPSPLEALGPTRTTMTILGASGRDLAGRLGLGFTYRTTMGSIFAVTSLPVEAADPAITELSLALAGHLAETGRLIADLPPEAVFVEVRDAAVNASERYATWQLEYLDTLRQGDAGRARRLIAERGAALTELSSMLTAALAVTRSELDALIVILATELEAAIVAVPG
jgi:hypothetical protein